MQMRGKLEHTGEEKALFSLHYDQFSVSAKYRVVSRWGNKNTETGFPNDLAPCLLRLTCAMNQVAVFPAQSWSANGSPQCPTEIPAQPPGKCCVQ
ncbi:hypothetical protein E2C01_006747 [Portunus trituberculatus]|uniref:Uncharacterized protein n=1 Tax=Portunus trituberculatus TaxID=210409 RepID=A0A5B7CYZ1_PORTR|nr:hypothetical protein [Portunus trituberculatus]